MPIALITGITGQDGSYLAELLLDKGYKVYGLVQRFATDPYENIRHVLDRVEIITGDLADSSSLVRAVQACQPDEVYNLAAQSFVKASWDLPELTGDITGVGVVRMLEAIRNVKPDAKFYQASSSEMFGKVRETPQNENTPFYPRSPYGVSKVYGHWITVNYRESYDMFACSGILFNHECLAEDTPLVIRHGAAIDVVPVEELVPLRRNGKAVQTFELKGVQIWDGEQWTDVHAITATSRRSDNPDHEMLSVEARGGIVTVTSHHWMIDEHGENVQARDLHDGSNLLLASALPTLSDWTAMTPELAEFLGLMTADGYVSEDGKKIQFTNNNKVIAKRVAELWSKLFLGSTYAWVTPSGWDPKKNVGQLSLTGANAIAGWLRDQLYTKRGYKRVSPLVLNADIGVQEAFLKGHYLGGGLKRGKGQSVKTNSATLAQGLQLLYANQGRLSSVHAEHRGGTTYYQLNITSANVVGKKGQHLRKNAKEVGRVTAGGDTSTWVFDIETGSKKFMAGVGTVIVHNSPRRGLEFVTRKITDGVARIKLGLAKELRLGNLEAKRDWGFAGDYVEAMWLMLQQDKPQDFVVGTGQTHSVQEFVELAFSHVDLDWKKYVAQDKQFMRPAEVDVLQADPAKAKKILGWEPKVKFEQLVPMMVEADLQRYKQLTTDK